MMIDKEKNREVFKKIYDNYNNLNQMMVEEMELSSSHGGLTGDYREQMWIKLFRSIIPQKFSIAQGVMIIDSYGNVSKEVDIAVFDEQYTPYVFQYNTLKFIPIEAVSVIIECKSESPDEGKLEVWGAIVNKLIPKACGIARFATGYSCGLTNKSQVKTRPIKILATTKNSEKEDTLNKMGERLGAHFDIIVQKHSNTFTLIIPNEDKSIGWWADNLNGTEGENKEKLKLQCKCGENIMENNKAWIDKECSSNTCFDKTCIIDNTFARTLADLEIKRNIFLSLNLQLNQLLMLINNPMLFPHYAYANCFNKYEFHKDKK